MKKETCCIKGCRSPVALTYYRKKICQAHFDKHCEGFINLKEMLKIKELPRIFEKQKRQEQLQRYGFPVMV